MTAAPSDDLASFAVLEHTQRGQKEPCGRCNARPYAPL
jgi:hypothetical protein